MKRDRFDLEQDIMNCWNVVDDLKMLLRMGTVNQETVDAITVLYQQKFEALWATFEDCAASAQFSADRLQELPENWKVDISKQTYGVAEESNN